MIGSQTRQRSGRRWYHPLGLLSRLVLYLAIGFVAVCALLYFMQGRMIYVGAARKFTPEQAWAQAASVGLAPWSIKEGDAFRGFVEKSFSDPAPRGTIVLLHGNGEYSWGRWDEAQAFRQRGFRTLLYEYPGYGGRPGVPSELTIVPDVRAVVRALDHAGLGPIYLWGQSLGSGVAAAACADETLPVQGLALITPFDTLPNVGAVYYAFIPVHQLMIDRYDSVVNLAHFAHPICVLRSDHDASIPPRLSLNLFEHLPEPKKMIVFLNAGHNDWPGDTPDTWWDEALDFIAPRS